jgi:hypothetical protein
MALDYDTYVDQISNLLVIGSTDANFLTMLPGMIAYAEGRIYRELDLVATSITNSTAAMTAGNRSLTLPSSYGNLIINNVNVITPATATSTSGTRNPLAETTPDVIDAIWGADNSNKGQPKFWAPVDNETIIVGPSPDAAYPVEIRAVQQNPTPLSSTNTTTILTEMLPDVFIAASMVFGSGYTRDFSAQGDNPAQGQSWETQYQLLKASAEVQEFRKTYEASAWTARQPTPIAQPPRV